MMEMRQQARTRYWNNFLASISKGKNLASLQRKVSKVRGIRNKPSKPIGQTDPKSKANELANKWAYDSRFESLPDDNCDYLRIYQSV